MSARSAQARLVNYVRQTDPELFAVMEQLCMEYSLQAGKLASGITFLRPVDEATRKKIFALAKSDDLDEVYQATHLLNAMIITNYIPTHREFHNRKDDIVNRLNQKVQVGAVNAAKIEFGSGDGSSTYAVIDSSFKDSSKTPKYSLYTLYGELPTDAESVETNRRSRKGRRGRKSKSKQAEEQAEMTAKAISATKDERSFIFATTAGEYYDVLLQGSGGSGSSGGNDASASAPTQMQNPYLIKSLSLLMFVKKKHPALYPHLLARTNLDNSDLYLYLQSNGDKFLISPEILNEWNRGDVDLSGMSATEACAMAVKDINEFLYENSAQRVDALDNIDDYRDEMRDNLIDYNKVKNTYTKLLKHIPENILSGYSVEQKMWEDDFRMSCWALFDDVEAAAHEIGRNPLYTLEDALGKLNECMEGPYEDRMCILRGGKHTTKDIPVFINSVYFMYIPVFDIEEDMDLIPVDDMQPHLDEDSIFAGNVNGVEGITKSLNGVILGSNLSTTQVLSALDIMLAKKRAKTLTKEEEWKLSELLANSSESDKSS